MSEPPTRKEREAWALRIAHCKEADCLLNHSKVRRLIDQVDRLEAQVARLEKQTNPLQDFADTLGKADA